MLRLNGYSTGAFGKSPHETAAWEISPVRADRPLADASGFDKFYGFIGGETNQWSPRTLQRQSQVRAAKDPSTTT